MADFNRRAFLAGCGAVGAGTLFASVPLTWGDIKKVATEHPLDPRSGILVLVTMYGGNDGINTLIPYADDAYYDARPELAYQPDDVRHLDGQYGLNPGMPGLATTFDAGSLAIIRGVGYPHQDRSHFKSMDIWQTASMDNDVTTGWIGRWLDSADGNPLKAINVGVTMPPLGLGDTTSAATLSLDNIDLDADIDEGRLIASLGTSDRDDHDCIKLVRESYRRAAKVDHAIGGAFGEGTVPHNERSDDNDLSAQLNVVSTCIRAGLPTQVYCVSIDGFDTHADEKSKHQKLLNRLDRAVTQFLDDMSGIDSGHNIVVMAYSEFGRRVAANASDGTDHGTSGPVFLAGAPVRGGLYGDDPSLTDLVDGDLKTSTDFRSIYSELLAKTLSTDPAEIVGSDHPHLGLLK